MHTKNPADTTTTTVSVCSRCGTIGKSDKSSCCGRGGSWFRNCGGTGNAKLQHAWYEGIQACKARSQPRRVIGDQLSVAQQKDTDSSQGGVMMSNYKAAIAATKTFALTSVNTLTSMSDTTAIVTSTYTPDNVPITMSARTLMTNPSTNIFMTSSTRGNQSRVPSISIFACLSWAEVCT